MITPYLKMIVTGSEVKPGLHKILGCREHKGSFWVLGNLEEGGAGPQALRKGAGRWARERGRSGLAGGTALRAETHLVPRAVRGGSEKFGLGLSAALGSWHTHVRLATVCLGQHGLVCECE